jgi:hypothetical protein
MHRQYSSPRLFEKTLRVGLNNSELIYKYSIRVPDSVFSSNTKGISGICGGAKNGN